MHSYSNKTFGALLATLVLAALPSLAFADDGFVDWGGSGTQSLGGTYGTNDPFSPTNIGGILSNSGFQTGYLNLGPGDSLVGGSNGLGAFGSLNLGTTISNSSFGKSLGLGQSTLGQSSLNQASLGTGIGVTGITGSNLGAFGSLNLGSTIGNSPVRNLGPSTGIGGATGITTGNLGAFGNTNLGTVVGNNSSVGQSLGQSSLNQSSLDAGADVVRQLGNGTTATERCSGGMCQITVRDNQGNVTSRSTAPVGATLTINGVSVDVGSRQSDVSSVQADPISSTARPNATSNTVATDYDLPDGTTLITLCNASSCRVGHISTDGTIINDIRNVAIGTAITAGGSTVFVGQNGTLDPSDQDLDSAANLAADASAANAQATSFSLQKTPTNLYPQTSNQKNVDTRSDFATWGINRPDVSDPNFAPYVPVPEDGSYTPIKPGREVLPERCDAGNCRVSNVQPDSSVARQQFASNNASGIRNDVTPTGSRAIYGSMMGGFDPFNPTPISRQNTIGTGGEARAEDVFRGTSILNNPSSFTQSSQAGLSTDSFAPDKLVQRGQTVSVLTTTNQSGTLVVSNSGMAPAGNDSSALWVRVAGRNVPLRNVSPSSNPSSLDILRTQWVLTQTGHLVTADAGGGFDSMTVSALKNFQASENLPTTGILDSATAARLNYRMGGLIDAQYPTISSPTPSAVPAKMQGRVSDTPANNGEQIRALQQQLFNPSAIGAQQNFSTGVTTATDSHSPDQIPSTARPMEFVSPAGATQSSLPGSLNTPAQSSVTGVSNVLPTSNSALNSLNSAIQSGGFGGLGVLNTAVTNAPGVQQSSLTPSGFNRGTPAPAGISSSPTNPIHGIPMLNFVTPQGNDFTSPGYTPGAGTAFGGVPNSLFQVTTFTSVGQPSGVSPANNAMFSPSLPSAFGTQPF